MMHFVGCKDLQGTHNTTNPVDGLNGSSERETDGVHLISSLIYCKSLYGVINKP